mmetsp:Transcript_4759/g.15657  ORF Transcript_4759/g.15657 Transcript_4759/m.15657 type:complete len:387 (+) Transcript_4759:54-1214(+)
MDRGIPCGSKICARREDERRHQLHRARIQTAKRIVDTAEPSAQQMDHVRNNLKREQLLEERYSEIDRENRILLKKMSEIMQNGSLATPRPDDRRTPGPMSLNRDARKKELLRITKDNQNILRRIQQAQPVYNHVEMEGGFKKNVNYLKNCAEYPLVLRTPRSARGFGANASSELVRIQEDVPQAPLSARLPLNRGAAESESHQQRSRDAEASRGDAKRCVFKEGKWLGDKYYLLELVTDNSGALYVTAFDGEEQVQLELVVKEKVHRRLYRELNGDYSLLAARLGVAQDHVGGRSLVLGEEEEPRHQQPLPQTPQGLTQPPSTAGSGRPVTVESGGELDADGMISARVRSAGSVHAEIDFGSTFGDTTVRLRGLTPQTPMGGGSGL